MAWLWILARRFGGFACVLALFGGLTGTATAASREAEAAVRQIGAEASPKALLDRLGRAIGLEKRRPAPDAYFLLSTLARKARLLGNKSNPLSVGEEGFWRP